jgi:hypothetical protein
MSKNGITDHGTMMDTTNNKNIVTLDGVTLKSENGQGFMLITFDAGDHFSADVMETRLYCQATDDMMDNAIESIKELQRQMGLIK